MIVHNRLTCYATQDYGDGRIQSDAKIVKFATVDAAREWLLAPYRAAGWDLATAVIEAGTWGDCWIKSVGRPRAGDPWIAPFSFGQISTQSPGEHPGGRFYWTTPTVEVLIVSEIHEPREG